ncbi:MAG: cytochrome d ubiquinol oxidase subunit II [bacterium]|nr:cytochrome d ubiquinol oxidase subunit II [bacterium]
MTAIVLLACCALAPTIHLRGHYSDDFPNRLVVEQSGCWGAWETYRAGAGWIRPLGYLALFATQQWLWDYPVAQQGLLLALNVALCLLTYAVATRLAGDRVAGLAAAAILAAWPSYTALTAWVAGGIQMLPAYVALLGALLLYLRHLEGPRSRKRYAGAVALFALSVTLHDQHLGTAALFSVLALSCAPAGRRLRAVVGSGAFWLLALAMGIVAVVTARQTARPLDPTVAGLIAGLPTVVGAFFDLSIVQPICHSLIGAGPAESVSRMLEADPGLLAVAGLTLIAAVVLIFKNRGLFSSDARSGRGGAVRLAAAGAVLFLAGLAIMALRSGASLQGRHTLLPAIGLSMAAASIMACLQGRRQRRIGATVLAACLIVLSVFRLGYAYEWTTRTRVTQAVLAGLDEVYPEARSGDLLVIDGLRRYGRGFCDSWGLTGAMKLRRSCDLRVTTLVRCEAGRLVANNRWDGVWEVDPEDAAFFAWHEPTASLTRISVDEYLARHPELAVSSG